MQKMTIAEAADFFGISKEAIHNRVRRGSLLAEIIDGEKHVIIDDMASVKIKATPKKPRAKSNSPRTSVPKTDERYYNLLKEQNTKLQEKVEKLEGETRSLRDQKEQMLRDERIKIEQIYKDKDEQLKSIINAISSKFMLTTPSDLETQKQEEPLEAEIEIVPEDVKPSKVSSKSKRKKEKVQKEVPLPIFKKAKEFPVNEQSILTSLSKYLKARDFSKKKRKKIKERFKENAKNDKRIMILNNKLYIDLGKYSYKDYFS